MSNQESTAVTGSDTDAPADTSLKTKVVAGVFALFAIQWALVGIGFVAFADAISDIPVADAGEAAGVYLAVGLVFFAFALLDLAIGYGLWRARRWGWYAGAAIAGISTLFWVAASTGDPSVTTVALLLVALFCTWALWDDRERFLAAG